MIPKTRIPQITEFMNGYLIDNYRSNSNTMRVFIPQIMMDRSINDASISISPNNIFKTIENLSTSHSVSSNSFIEVKVSPYIQTTYSHMTNGYITLSKGTLVRIFVPNLDLDNAIIIPF